VIRSWLAAESAFDPLLWPYRVRADRIMVGMNVFLLMVCLAIAPLRNTWGAVLAVGGPTLLMSLWLLRSHAGALVTRLFMASAFMVFTGLIIHQTGGDIEAHFSAFGLIGVLLYYRDWRTIIVATVVIYLHHLVLGYAQTLGAPVYVFDTDSFWTLFGLHVAYFLPFIGMMAYLAVWLRREGYESQHVIALAQRIVQGNLLEDEAPLGNEANMPLVKAVRMMKSRLLDLLRVMPVAAAVIRIDTESIVSVNEAWVRTIGPLDDLHTRFGQSPIWADTDTWTSLMARMREASGNLLDKVEVVLKKADGTPFLCELSLILHEDVDPVMAILTIEDISLRRKTELTMQRLAYRDMLTDLPNRVSLQADLDRALADWRERQTPFALIMMDLDGFKPVNDTHGHDAGDEVLKVVGARLQRLNRPHDLAARLGGDEFVIVLHDCPSAAVAAEVAQRFLDALSRPIRIEPSGLRVEIGASAGVAHVADEPWPSSDTLLKNADSALYQAKALGKNRVQVFAPAVSLRAN